MTLAMVLLMAAAAGHAGAQASALVTVRIVQGERISFSAPQPAPDRQLRETQRSGLGDERPVTLKLVEFQ